MRMKTNMPQKQARRAAPFTLRIRALGGDKTRGIIQAGHLRLPCALGRGGITPFKREGDNATPRARLHSIGGFYKPGRGALPPCRLPLRRSKKTDGWCDSPQDRNYNRPVRLPYAGSAENLRRSDNLYDTAFILDWNIKPRIKGRGSAIFLHIARPAALQAVEAAAPKKTNSRRSHAGSQFHPTAGCIAVSPHNMRLLMPLLRKNTAILISD